MDIQVIKRDGSVEPFSVEKIHKVANWACEGLDVSQSELEIATHLMAFDGIKSSDIHQALIKSASTLISVEQPQYTFVAARLLLQTIYKEVSEDTEYPTLRSYIQRGVSLGRINKELLDYDLEALNAVVDKNRDLQFTYLGLQTLVDRYLVREDGDVGKKGRIIELPQHMFMRVAMGLALREKNRTAATIQFYSVLSKFEFMSSTPTLFNAGTNHSQLSSCYLNTVADSIDYEGDITEVNRYASIFGTIQECANLSKFAGGIGTDWTRVRSEGDHIKSTNGKSSGIVPYLKVFNDAAIAVNQGGKRNGAFAAYLEPWHPDLYEFIDLKKNSGDERRRAHDIFPALWIPDLMLERVENNGVWSFFSPGEFPELHELYGDAFKARYEELEAAGKFRKQVPALEVWRKILTSLFETGHPWITFKDECNRRNPQSHVGVIHNSNLCTEITLNTSDEETAVCNLGSINLVAMMSQEHLRETVRTAIRMLDNVVDINFYPSKRAEQANMRHRPIGLGVMGYTEWLVKEGIDWESERHLQLADELFEAWSFYAIEASTDLAAEKGAYSSFEGSKWSQGIMPIDTARDKHSTMNWDGLANKIKQQGMRNSNVMAIAPTATISNIVGTTPCIEPIFKRQYTKTNLSGSFVVVDPSLSYGRPELCKEAFEIDQEWLIRAAAVRQKWIDQAQSTNLFVKSSIRGSDLAGMYMQAWKLGLKTTYYLRSQSKELGDNKNEVIKQEIIETTEPETKFCSIDNPDCESCQ
ncbi:NrdA Ribonucleotide reductase, alpha subunit [uncultured Caudovirales phage]|uniref:Ribonucleoside-diphosphate reductase n=1 Tax=uncultured Caudovirales phage TaxID=2100421 RepID=A0A6J5KNC8_9CAUD|nr:NrdA Ribonucleotide reductase, alpha subunit [uncultured Caudovirales phage]CAB4123894.1 NrdA Ribonucleotide reductase, alpha subunit [uncultured Caudovirales phage]CAB5219361.1 NrdA Ribonucleotide reductase, alpha subunit [uncultured Caudovirales phage]